VRQFIVVALRALSPGPIFGNLYPESCMARLPQFWNIDNWRKNSNLAKILQNHVTAGL